MSTTVPDPDPAANATGSTMPAAPARLVIVNAGVSSPSSTRLLADRLAQKSIDQLRRAGIAAGVDVIELGPLAVDIAHATIAGFPNERLQNATDRLATADAVIAATRSTRLESAGCSSHS
ncbi:hypothetical protein ACAG26_15790 [Mycobacterium sp. pUA109]|uniref:hypothetical protein n=1 Tax=Mycobacterium sp. pUA109 TaxID=3238982 RepID=UPI00351BAB16